MIKLADRYHCTGCTTCANVCSHHAIMMQPDDEGFLQPVIDSNKCIKCELCMKCCPVLNPLFLNVQKQEAYALISYKDRNISSSGGAFSVFAKQILKQGGVVFGATIDEKLIVKHIYIEKEEELFLLRGSKYVQSNLGDIYKTVKKFLLSKTKVLFSGTPCQIAGLYSYLGGRRYEDILITLDLVCHGVPSQGTFDAYIKKLQRMFPFNGDNIVEFRFRKFDSWSIIPVVKLTKSKWQILNLSENAYMDAFFEGITFRESCFNCQYCNTKRVGTFTIADFWGIGRHGQTFKKNVACGVSLVIDNQNKMPQLLSEFTEDIYVEKRSMQEAIVEQTNLKFSVIRQDKRDTAIKTLMDPNTSLKEFSKIYGLPYKITAKYLIIKIIKDLIYFFGLYNVYKTIIYKLNK